MTTRYCTVVLDHFYRQMQYFTIGEESLLYKRVVVPVLHRTYLGVVVAEHDTTELEDEIIRSIIRVVDDHPILRPDLAETIMWCAHRFMLSPWHLIKMSITPYFLESERHFIPPSPRCRVLKLPMVLPDMLPIEATPRWKRGADMLHALDRAKGCLATLGKTDYINLGILFKKGYIEFLPCSSNIKPQAMPDKFQGTQLVWSYSKQRRIEFMLEAVEAALLSGGQILICAASIKRVQDLAKILRARFSRHTLVALYSSSHTPKLKAEEINAIRFGLVRIVITTRSGAFMPLPNLSMIIVDEEHSSQHKSVFRHMYCAKAISIIRADLLKIPLIFFSATPSSEAFSRVKLGLCKLVDLNAGLRRPKIKLIDIRTEKVDAARISLYAHRAIDAVLQQKKQVLVFLNRIGFARAVTCRTCRSIYSCPLCHHSLTLLQDKYKTRYFHCRGCMQFKIPADSLNCPSCQESMKLRGYGTDYLFAHFKQNYPEVYISQIDSNERDLEDELRIISRGYPQIIVATEMVHGKIDLQHIGLILFLDLDRYLRRGDSNWEELEKHIGLAIDIAEQSSTRPMTLIQTTKPQHAYMQAIKFSSYDKAVSKDVLNRRKRSSYKAHVLISCRSYERLVQTGQDVYHKLSSTCPMGALISKFALRSRPLFRGKHRGFIQVATLTLEDMHSLLKCVAHNGYCTIDLVPDNSSL